MDEREKAEKELRKLLDEGPPKMPERLKSAWLTGISANSLDLKEYESLTKTYRGRIRRLRRAMER